LVFATAEIAEGEAMTRGQMVSAFTVLFALQLEGCGGAMQIVLKPPVTEKCESTGLKGCEELTDGVLLYVEGKKDEARVKIRAGVGANTPGDVKTFARGLKLVISLPGISSYAAPIREVVDILADEADALPKTTPEKTVSKAGPKTKTTSEPKEVVASAEDYETKPTKTYRTSTIVPSAKGAACAAFAYVGVADHLVVDGSKAASAPAAAVCANVTSGPFVITDIQIGPGCPNELFVLAGDREKPRWFVISPAGTLTSIHGAAFVLKEDEHLVVGARATPPPPPAPSPKLIAAPKKAESPAEPTFVKDVECAITWAGHD
jgi:hypothetical protein